MMNALNPKIIADVWREAGEMLLIGVPGGGQVVAWGTGGGVLHVVHRFPDPTAPEAADPITLSYGLSRMADELSRAAFGEPGKVTWRLLP